MTGPDVEATLRDHSYEHRRGSICLCGFIPTVDPATLATQQDYHRAHVAAVLSAEIAKWLRDEAKYLWSGADAYQSVTMLADQLNPYRASLAATEGDRQ